MKKLVLALAAVAMIATPALADVTPYGSARVAAFYADSDRDTSANTTQIGNPAFATTTTTFNLALQSNSRFGIKANTGDVTGRVEVGMRNPSDGGNYARLIYGTVKAGAGTLLVGQSYTKYTKFTNQVLNQDLGNIGFGALYDGRQPQITYTMDNGLYFSAIRNSSLAADGDLIPKLNVGFAGKAGSFTYNAGVAYSKFDAETATAGVFNTATNYFVYVCGDAKFGNVGMIYGLHYGQNIGSYGIGGRSQAATFNADENADSTGYGFLLEVDVAGFAIGAGYTADDSDVVAATEVDAQATYYVNYTYQVAKGFKIVPELAAIDMMDNAAGVDEGGVWAFGAKFQMDF